MTRFRRWSALLVRGIAPLMVATLLLPTAVTAQENSVQITALTADGWPSVEATVTVVDADGRPITGLAADSFTPSVDGIPVPIADLRTANDPGIGVAVVLVFDVSGSMAGAPIENARAAGQALVSQLGDADQAAVIAFSTNPVIVQGFTSDKVVLDGAIGTLAAGGDTALYAAVEESVRLASTAPLTRRAIVLLSDGFNFGAGGDPASALASVDAGAGLLMTVGLGDDIDGAFLTELAARGGGQFRAAPSPEDLTSLYKATADVLRQQYVLTLDASSLDPITTDGRMLRIVTRTGSGEIATEGRISVPAAFLTTQEPSPTAAPATPGATPVAAEDDSQAGTSLAPYLVAAAVGAAIVAGALVLFARRTRSEAPEVTFERMNADTRPPSFPAIDRAVTDEAVGGWLHLENEERVALGESPVTVGFTTDCDVVLLGGASPRPDRARIWRRDGSYMLHNLSRTGSVTISGRPVTWAVLEDGDRIDIGGCPVTFRDAANV